MQRNKFMFLGKDPVLFSLIVGRASLFIFGFFLIREVEEHTSGFFQK